MSKDFEHQQQMPQPYAAQIAQHYPTQLPSAPPTYDEVLSQGAQYAQGAQYPQGQSYPQGQPYPQAPSHHPGGSYSQAPYPIQATAYVAPSAGYMQPPAGASYYVPPPVVEVHRTTTTTTVVALPLGPNSARIKCPHCHAEILTRTDTEPSCAAHLCCILILLIGCLPFSSLPYCMDSMKNVRHSCPNCNRYLGCYQP